MIVFLQACKGTQPKQTFEQGFFAGNHCLVYCLCNCTLYYVLHSWECRQWFPWENKDMCQIRKTQYWHRVNHETKIPWECRKPKLCNQVPSLALLNGRPLVWRKLKQVGCYDVSKFRFVTIDSCALIHSRNVHKSELWT